ncbi:MAG: hypothetical protein Q8R92_05230 [Deltaproteobacteria bacterium]|nr:hypothetical protein [Deltaproteobacteria bacterium]
MSRESLARATNSKNMEMESGITHDVDRLAAAAGGDTLGGLLLRMREGAQARWAKRVILILANRIREKHKLTRSIAEKTAMAALEEFLAPHCTVCRGARVMVVEKVKIVCEGCGGTGLQRFSNTTRRQNIGTYGSRIEGAMADAHGQMSDALGAYLSHAAVRLK